LTPVSEIEERIRTAASQWKGGQATLASIVPLTPDASLRRYFRLNLKNESPSTAVVMWFDSTTSPEASGAAPVAADDAYVALTLFFRKAGVSVPELYFDGRASSLLIIEDLGDRTLASCVDGKRDVWPLFKKAIDQIVTIQRIVPEKGFFACERAFTAELYSKEMSEFEEYLLAPLHPGASVMSAVSLLRANIAQRLEGCKKVLVHRDFHGWNLLVPPDESIRVIDFQDALMATSPYDLVSLINDRDMDTLIGRQTYTDCVEYFRTQSGFGYDWLAEYDLALLQRDLKVAGRFAKLVNVRKLEQYGKWIPGTLRRIGSTLERMVHAGNGGEVERQAFDIVVDRFPECASGAALKLRWNN